MATPTQTTELHLDQSLHTISSVHMSHDQPKTENNYGTTILRSIAEQGETTSGVCFTGLVHRHCEKTVPDKEHLRYSLLCEDGDGCMAQVILPQEFKTLTDIQEMEGHYFHFSGLQVLRRGTRNRYTYSTVFFVTCHFSANLFSVILIQI